MLNMFLFNILIVGWANASYAELSCIPKNKISVPPEILNYYFSSEQEVRIFPVGNTKCKLEASSVNIINGETGLSVGIFQISQIINTPFNEAALFSKKVNPSILKAIKPFGKSINPIKFMYSLSLFNNNPMNFNKDMFFAIGKITKTDRPNIDWSPYQDKDKHWAAKVINYKELIQFFADVSVEYVHTGDLQTYYIPIVNNQSNYASSNNTFKNPIEDFTLNVKIGAPLKNNPVIVVSNTAFNTQGYNTVTNLYFEGYRKIFWFKDATLEWRDRLSINKDNIYPENFETLTNQDLANLIQKRSLPYILDLSEEPVYQQVHFKKAIREYPVYFNPEDLSAHLKKTYTPERFQRFLKSKFSLVGSHMILDTKKSLPPNSPVIIIINNHYINNYIARSIFIQLKNEGHKPKILETSTGEFLSYLLSNNLGIKDMIVEQQDLHYRMPKVL